MELLAFIAKKSMYDMRLETHDNNEFIICKEGSGILCVSGKTYQVSTGTVAYIPAGVDHSDMSLSPRVNAHVFFTTKSTDAVLREAAVFQDTDKMMEHLCSMAVDAINSGSDKYKMFASAVGDAMVELLRCNKTAPNIQDPATMAIDVIENEIKQRYSDVSFNVADEIEKTGYSAGYFRRIFKDATGMSPLTRLNYVRIENAKIRMQIYGNQYTIKDIGNQVGFSDQYYFSRIFKKTQGISPSEYIEQIEKKGIEQE